MHQTAKVALITGAARRIGAEIAHNLHKSGWNIILHYLTSQADAEKLSQALNAKRPNSAIAFPADLQIISQMDALVEQAVQKWGRLDALINNASTFYKTPLGTVNEKDWDDLLDVNVKAPFFLSQAAAPYLKENQGCIINITDIHTAKPLKEHPVYCVSKAGLAMLTKALAKELGPEIRVNAVAPGAIMWPEGENKLDNATKEKIIKKTLLGRHGHPSDIAQAILYLIDASYVTGQILNVDGGRGIA